MEVGYDEIAIEDFHELFFTEVKNLKTVDPKNACTHLMKILCNKDEANFIIMYARFMTAAYLK